MTRSIATSFLLYSISWSSFSQDTVIYRSNIQTEAKVLEVNKDEIQYKRYSNIDGPTYTVDRSEIHSIKFSNGEIEEFAPRVIEAKKDTSFQSLTQRGNSVFVHSNDDHAQAHAIRDLRSWGYWKITNDRESADFVLEFIVEYYHMGEAQCWAEFIVPENQSVIKTTDPSNSLGSAALNSKRTAVNNLIVDRIIPLFQN
ncbi:MAG: hypothetical protein IPI00_00180 [Flavobacteriales bacterium]|nr:hypothetical protein [Flavobacteriales bacterium]MBK6946435.1 hypothetical protein [Flavobacteriales bacterium]MBK7238607.1 hypothetical protein [Flavobacteriales bacterium]MBK7297966.1 hypothetical protein [Flavobacteriales bacterium]MBK9536483.1 hypothetical protein [Flavobacteriales bacterium]